MAASPTNSSVGRSPSPVGIRPRSGSVTESELLRGPMILKQYIVSTLAKAATNLQTAQVHLDYIKQQLRSEPKVQVRWLECLAATVTNLSEDRIDLVETALSINFAADDAVFEHLREFFLNLVSTNTRFLLPIFTSLVRSFAKPAGPSSQTSIVRTHSLIQDLILLVPTAPTTLQKVFADEFPHYGVEAAILLPFVQAALTAAEYAPAASAALVAAVVDLLIRIDIETQVSKPVDLDSDGDCSDSDSGELMPSERMEGLDEDEDDGCAGVFAVDAWGGVSDDERLHALEMAGKLDVLLDEVLRFLAKHAADPENARSIFVVFLHLFDNAILRTAKCRHIQFLLFYLCSLSPDFQSLFSGYLVGVAKADDKPAVVRAAAASYLASFLARAKYVTVATVQKALVDISQWLLAYIETHTGDFDPNHLMAHQPFYACAQALLYVLCFHFDAISAEANGARFLAGLGLDRVVSSVLNPLAVCVGSVVEVFARIALSSQLAYCYDIIRQNADRRAASRMGRGIRLQLAALRADFPFDECGLPNTRQFVDPLFRSFGGELESVAACDDAASTSSSAFGCSPLLGGLSPSIGIAIARVGSAGAGRGLSCGAASVGSASPSYPVAELLLYSKFHSPPSGGEFARPAKRARGLAVSSPE
eukprot:c8660_g1_i1.p1 GENE.c8660_g1_i1~~c8660_g1_i1.p1  ORF type:complete len:649 (-),score=85.50 c8660_g1_i1:17-1963(-)